MGVGLKDVMENDIVKIKLEDKTIKGKIILFDDANIMLDASEKYNARIVNVHLEDIKSIKKVLK